MGENEKKLCSECGAEMQEYRGKYFCLDCGCEYETVTNDFGEETIVLVSGKYEKKVPEAEPVREKVKDRVKEPKIRPEGSGNKARETVIGILLGIAVLAVIVGVWSIFGGSDDNKNNNGGNQIVAENEKEPEETAAPEDENPPIVEDEPTQDPEPTKTPEPTKKPEPVKTEPPKDTPEPTPTAQPSGAKYRVRRSADDVKEQKGAFAELENAKRLADELKADGYKVYDMDGKLVYAP